MDGRRYRTQGTQLTASHIRGFLGCVVLTSVVGLVCLGWYWVVS